MDTNLRFRIFRPHQMAAGKQASRRRPKRERTVMQDSMRITFTTVLDKLAKGDAEPLIPKKAPENVRREIEKSGGAFLWAESQPDYWDLLQKKKKKLNRKVTHRTTVVTSSSNDDNIRILRGKLDEHEKGMRRAETEYEKHAHALKDLKQRIAELEAKISDC
jgi:hypothetical protein